MTSMTSGRRVVNGVIGSPDLAGSGQRSLVSVSDQCRTINLSPARSSRYLCFRAFTETPTWMDWDLLKSPSGQVTRLESDNVVQHSDTTRSGK